MRSEFQKPDETESDIELVNLLKSLDRVSAPPDFAVRVKSRIAAGKTVRSAVWPGVFLRIGAPVTAMLVLIGFIWFFSAGIPDARPIAVAEPEPHLVKPLNEETRATAAVNSPDQVAPRINERASATPARPETTAETRTRSNDGGGSIDFSVRPGNVRQPRIDANTKAIREKESERSATIPMSGVLSDLGIDASAESGKWVVRTIRPNSLADRSGIIPGDVIEAIDDRPVGPETVFVKSAEGTAVTVTRKGVRLVIPLK